MGASQFEYNYNWRKIKPIGCIGMQHSSCYWSIQRANLYLLNQLPKAKIDGSNITPIISKDALVGGFLSSRGVVFEVIQSLWFTLSACVGTGSWSKESPGGSASPYVDWERNAAKKSHHSPKKRPPETTSWKLINATTAPHAQTQPGYRMLIS